MLIDSSSKESFTTMTEEIRNQCSCGLDKLLVRQKLEEILNTLYEEIAAKQKQIQKAHYDSAESIRQKQEIIERLVSANSKLVIQNQSLYRKLAKTEVFSKSTINKLQSKYEALLKEMTLQINYLEQRNQFLKSQILSTVSYIPDELLPYQMTPKAPRSRCSNQKLHPSSGQTRHSHISYKSPEKRQNIYLSPSHYATYWVTKSRKRNSNRTESRAEDVQDGGLSEKRSKSSVGRQQLSLGGI